VVVSESAMPGDRSSGLRFGDLGEQELHDLDRPLRLFLLEHVG